MFHTDGHYTQGFKVAYLQEDGVLPRWAAGLSAKIPAWGFSLRTEKFGYELGQSIYTPLDIGVKTLVSNDRPYAGWLYSGFILQRRGLAFGNQPMLESFQLDFGAIGRASLAEVSQALFHELDNSAKPAGWAHQLKDEPGLALKYQRSWRFSPAQENVRYVDFIPHAGASLGNVDTSFRLGATVRLGWNLPDDFGAQTIDSLITTEGGWSPSRTGGRWGFYLFTGVEGRAVLYTVFLDGNLLRDGHHVAKEAFVGEWKSGFAFALRRWELGYTFVHRTPEFVKQIQEDRFGSLFIKYKF
ncbi:MAG: lipid A deacylase LpxR family protein [Verrucomicrobia bacterium]|nr:lipid A deacylase LpxR family protein [Verrucomicrobiota bacterium]